MKQCMEFAVLILILVVLPNQGVSDETSCFTWSIYENRLSLIYRSHNIKFQFPIRFFDPYGKQQANCTRGQNDTVCNVTNRNGKIRFDPDKQEINLTVSIKKVNLNGKWICKNRYSDETVIVSTDKGIIVSVNPQLTGQIEKSTFTTLLNFKCHSCWKIEQNTVQILVDNISYDSVRYYKGQCYNKHGKCSDLCSCLSNGSTYIWKLEPPVKSQQFTFRTKFRDDHIGSEFSKYTSVIFNGTDVIANGTATIIHSWPSDDEPKNKNNVTKDFSKLAVIIPSVLITLVALVTIVCALIKQFRNSQMPRKSRKLYAQIENIGMKPTQPLLKEKRMTTKCDIETQTEEIGKDKHVSAQIENIGMKPTQPLLKGTRMTTKCDIEKQTEEIGKDKHVSVTRMATTCDKQQQTEEIGKDKQLLGPRRTTTCDTEQQTEEIGTDKQVVGSRRTTTRDTEQQTEEIGTDKQDVGQPPALLGTAIQDSGNWFDLGTGLEKEGLHKRR